MTTIHCFLRACTAACLVMAASACGIQSNGPTGTTVAMVQVENSADSDPHAGLQAADFVL